MKERRKIPIAKPVIEDDDIEAVERILRSGMLAQGEEVRLFEEEFAEYIGTEYAVAVSSGTAALDLVLKAFNIGPGDEVITTSFSFVATANAILYQGARPVFADIDPKTYNIDPGDVVEKITGRTRAIIVVHLYGQPANIRALAEIAEDHNLLLIEDAAQAHGAEFLGKKVGSFGDAAVFSFYPTKNMTTGEGGIVTTNNKEIAQKIRLLRDHGQTEKYLHEILGWNLRMTNIAAALGRSQLRKLERLNSLRSKNAQLLSTKLSKIKGIKTPYVAPEAKHVWHQYVISVEDSFPLSRDRLYEELEKHGIGVAIHYPRPIHQQPLYRKLGYPDNLCPKAIQASRRVLSLPVHPAVTEDDIEYIASTMRRLAIE